MKKTISGLLALLLLLSVCVGCGNNTDPSPDQTDAPNQTDNTDPSDENTPVREGHIYTNLLGIDPNETALEVDGNTIPMELYFYWLTYSCSNLEYQLNVYSSYYGMYSELINEDGTAKWDQELDGVLLSQMAKEQAESSALSFVVLENEAAARGITLSDEDKAGVENDRASYMEQLGSQEDFDNNLWEMGISLDSFDRVSAVAYFYQHLLELAQDSDSDLYQAPADTDAYVDHILLMTIDSATQEPLTEEEIAAKKEKAEELLAQLQSTDAAELETVFTQLADENGEDPGRTTDTGYLIDADTSFVQEFKDAAFALQPGEISGIVESDYGYHILLRKELKEEHLSSISATKLSGYLDGQLEAAKANMVRSEKLDSIDVGKFYVDYVQAIQALHPELNADDGMTNSEAEENGTESDAEPADQNG